MRWIIAIGLMAFTASFARSQTQQFMPPNNLHLEIPLEGGLDESTFNEVLDEIETHYTDIVAKFDAKFVVNRLWTTNVVNASAQQSGNNWIINMYGGLARRPEVTRDGFALVACHELGHHLGGAVFYEGSLDWASSEGQSDYFASIACAKQIWRDDATTNATFEATLLALEGGDIVKQKCDNAYSLQTEQDLCYRTSVAGHSIATLLGKLGRGAPPSYATPDPRQVSKTDRAHPKAQCRLDTYVAGALCDIEWNPAVIPGKAQMPSELLALIAAKPYACHSYKANEGFRPTCWFNPLDIKTKKIDVKYSTDQKVKSEQTKNLKPIPVTAGEKITVLMRGSGNADLYVAFDRSPTLTDFDCRSRFFTSRERCNLTVPKGATRIFAQAVGKQSTSEVTITTKRQGDLKLCRNHKGGIGPRFSCFEDLKCRIINIKNYKDPLHWCLDY